jgi:hypothetical protein
MVRLRIETLEGRDLMSAGVSAGSGPAPQGPRTAVMTDLEEFANAAVSLTSPRDPQSGTSTGKLTAPLGSTKGSVLGEQDSAAVVVGFTPPIGSNKGSLRLVEIIPTVVELPTLKSVDQTLPLFWDANIR